MILPKRLRFSPSRGAIYAGALTLLACLTACEPPSLVPGSCGDVPPCSAYNYHVQVYALEPDTATGRYELSSSTFSAYFGPDWSVPALARSATSCIPCTGNVTLDSAYFTTDLVTRLNDTLKARSNLFGRSLPTGIQVDNGSVSLDSLGGIRFKDSLFEIRFSGMIDSVRKSASAKFRIADSALLLR